MSDFDPVRERELAEYLGQFYNNPVDFVKAVFPWGEPLLPDGTKNPLADKKGPEPWQETLLNALSAHIRKNEAIGGDPDVWYSAVSSGHGVGKSAVVAWLIIFCMTTRPNTRGVVTANTEGQLRNRTWPELAKWHKLMLNRHWFGWTGTQFYFALCPEDERKNYMITAETVSEQNSEAFQGLHNEGGTVLVIFDEASGIFPALWDVVMGAFTDGEGMFFAFGNPTRPDGPFFECFQEKSRDLFFTMQVSSFDVSHTNKNSLQRIIDVNGPDSDQAKIRVYGRFPSQSHDGFVPAYAVKEAMARELPEDSGAGLVLAVDVARFGSDDSVIGFRQGRDARTRPYRVFNGLDTVKLSVEVMRAIDECNPDTVVIESTGTGAGVIDILRHKGYNIYEAHPGAKSSDGLRYANVRAEMWDRMKMWILGEGCLPENDRRLYTELTSVGYHLAQNQQALQMQAKDVMRKKGLPSPDVADMLALTFAPEHIPRRDIRARGVGAETSFARLPENPFSF